MPQEEMAQAALDEPTLVTEEGYILKFRHRAEETVALGIPVDALTSIDRIAAQREMSREALLRFYIGQGLRQDLTNLYGEHVLAKTAEVLAKHLPSEEAVTAVLREIRSETARQLRSRQ